VWQHCPIAEQSRIALLGRLAVGIPTAASKSLPGRRSELVFAYLAAEHHRVVTRDELADALWPDRLPSSWSAALRGVVSEVRRFLDEGGLAGDDILITVRAGYQLVLPDRVVTDLDVVRAGLAEASARLAGSTMSANEMTGAAVVAAQVSSLAGLAFLPEHEGAWVDGVRRELARAHSRALALAAQALARSGDQAGAQDAAARLVELDPLDEGAHRLGIRLLAEAGDRAGAMRAYERCRDILVSELGFEPSPETAAATEAVPVAPRPESSSVTPAPAAGGARVDQLGVLVVEDHDFQRRTLVQILVSLGVAWVEAAPDGGTALDRLTRQPVPDIIICDIDMPGMDGVELVRHVSARDPGTAVIITSGLDASVLRAVESLSTGYGLEVLGALAKPLTARRLCQVLSAYTPRPSAPPEDVKPGVTVTADDLRRALAEGEVTAHFQPRFDLTTGELCALVATPRWPGCPRGAIPPSVLLSLAGQANLLGTLTDRLLQVSASLLADAGMLTPGVTIVVPVPRACQVDVALADRWAGIMRRHHFDRSPVVAAVEARHNPAGPAVLDVMTRLRLKGFGLSLHGFDGSPGALNHAERLPLTGLALAGRLVSGASADPGRRDMVEAAFDAARPLGLPVVADGCDSAADFEMLLALGCRQVQGEFLGVPMPADRLAHWIRTGPISIAERT